MIIVTKDEEKTLAELLMRIETNFSKKDPAVIKKAITAAELVIKKSDACEQEKYLVLDDHNLHVDSSDWTEIIVEGQKQKENPKHDGWEITEGEANGEQVFLWEGAMREANKAGKIIPSDKWLTRLLKTKSDMPNLVFAGYRNTDGTIRNQGKFAYFWTSSENGNAAWNQCLSSRDELADRGAHGKEHGFSVRCYGEKVKEMEYMKLNPTLDEKNKGGIKMTQIRETKDDKIYPIINDVRDHLQVIRQLENGELLIVEKDKYSKKYASWEDYINQLKNDIEKLEFNVCMKSFPETYKGNKDFQRFLDHQNNQRQLWLEDISQNPRKIGVFFVTHSWYRNTYKYIPARKKIEVNFETVFEEIDIIALKKATGTDDINKAIKKAVDHYLLQCRFDTGFKGLIDNLYNEVELAETRKQNRNGKMPKHPSDWEK